jgi:hypothetical protein
MYFPRWRPNWKTKEHPSPQWKPSTYIYYAFANFPIPLFLVTSQSLPPKVYLAYEYVEIEEKLTSFIHINTNEFLMNQVVLLDYKSDKGLALSIHPKKTLHEFQLYWDLEIWGGEGSISILMCMCSNVYTLFFLSLINSSVQIKDLFEPQRYQGGTWAKESVHRHPEWVFKSHKFIRATGIDPDASSWVAGGRGLKKGPLSLCRDRIWSSYSHNISTGPTNGRNMIVKCTCIYCIVLFMNTIHVMNAYNVYGSTAFENA